MTDNKTIARTATRTQAEERFSKFESTHLASKGIIDSELDTARRKIARLKEERLSAEASVDTVARK